MPIKVSNAQMAEVFRDAATALRKQASRITELESELSARDTRDRAEKVASEMHRKGLELDVSMSDLADRLEKAAAEGKLDAIEVGVDLVGPDMSSKLASLTNDETGSSSVASDFERYIVGTAG